MMGGRDEGGTRAGRVFNSSLWYIFARNLRDATLWQ